MSQPGASGGGDEGQTGGPLQELVSSMEAGQLGHKMNDSDIHDHLVSLRNELYLTVIFTLTWLSLHERMTCH